MKRFQVPFLLLALTTAARSAEPAEVKEIREGIAAPITIYTHFEERYSESSMSEMKAELATIMGPIGLNFEWRSLDGPRANEVSVDLVVVTFKGRCAMDALVRPIRDPGALGWTHTSDGHVLPFSDVECDRIRGFISPELGGRGADERQTILGRAMARVLAHELYHVFADTTRHASQGVAKAFYNSAELVSDRFEFHAKEAGTLRRGKVRTLVRAAAANASALVAGQ